jgi:UDP-glucose 4-epimerase
MHLAWSFSDDLGYLLEHDIRGHLCLQETARRQRVGRLLYASTVVVYGKPVRHPIDEDHPLLVLAARKPAYAVAKEFGEKLTLFSAGSGGPAAAVLRFWWAFGSEIGGRHLREMLKTAAAGQALTVPGDCGGSFLSLDDFVQVVGLLLRADFEGGHVYNLASAYVTWEEVAHLVVEVTGSVAPIRVLPRSDWTGAPFLAERWDLNDQKVCVEVGFKPTRDLVAVRLALREAISATWARVQTEGRHS